MQSGNYRKAEHMYECAHFIYSDALGWNNTETLRLDELRKDARYECHYIGNKWFWCRCCPFIWLNKVNLFVLCFLCMFDQTYQILKSTRDTLKWSRNYRPLDERIGLNYELGRGCVRFFFLFLQVFVMGFIIWMFYETFTSDRSAFSDFFEGFSDAASKHTPTDMVDPAESYGYFTGQLLGSVIISRVAFHCCCRRRRKRRVDENDSGGEHERDSGWQIQRRRQHYERVALHGGEHVRERDSDWQIQRRRQQYEMVALHPTESEVREHTASVTSEDYIV